MAIRNYINSILATSHAQTDAVRNMGIGYKPMHTVVSARAVTTVGGIDMAEDYYRPVVKVRGSGGAQPPCSHLSPLQ